MIVRHQQKWCRERGHSQTTESNRRETQVEDIPPKTQFNAETKTRQIIRAFIFIPLSPLCKRTYLSHDSYSSSTDVMPNRAETFSEIKSPDTQIQIQIHMTRPRYDCRWANAEIRLSNQHTTVRDHLYHHELTERRQADNCGYLPISLLPKTTDV